jgi:hypothetical protein
LERQGLWEGVRVPGGAFRPSLSVLPYLLGGLGPGGPSTKAGADLRYTVTPQLTAVGSLNPDFSGIAAALDSIAFSSTETYLPEHRPFFLEGGDFFQMPWGANSLNSLFYSLRIPEFDVGAKLFGRLSPRDSVGFLNTTSFGERNDSVLRYARSHGPSEESGLTVVSHASPSATNAVAALDTHRRWGKIRLDAMGAHSVGPGAGGGIQSVTLGYADRPVTTALHLTSVSNNFVAPNSFVPLRGYNGIWYTNFLNYSWRQGYWSGARGTFNIQDFRNFDGSSLWRSVDGRISYYARSDWAFSLGGQISAFEGRRNRTVSAGFTQGYDNRFRQFGLFIQTGTIEEAPSTFVAPFAQFRISRQVNLSYSGAMEFRRGVRQQHVLTLNYELSPTRSLGGRAVLWDADANAYLFYRNSGGRGTEYYVILGDPNARRTQRALQVKAVFAL